MVTHMIPDMDSGDTLAVNLATVKARIAEAAKAAGRTPDAVTLVAVAKTKPAALIRQALDAAHG